MASSSGPHVDLADTDDDTLAQFGASCQALGLEMRLKGGGVVSEHYCYLRSSISAHRSVGKRFIRLQLELQVTEVP